MSKKRGEEKFILDKKVETTSEVEKLDEAAVGECNECHDTFFICPDCEIFLEKDMTCPKCKKQFKQP